MVFRIQLVTPQRSREPIEVEHVTLPAFDGEWGIRTGHMPFVCLLVEGRLMIRGEETHRYRIGRGVAHLHEDLLEVFTESVVEDVAPDGNVPNYT